MLPPTFATYALTVDGRPAASVRAAVSGGHALLPVRVLGETLHARVTYDALSRTVVVVRNARRAALPARTARIIGGHAYAPLRTIAQTFGIAVAYDGATRTIALRERATLAATPVPTVRAAIGASALSPGDGATVHAPYPTVSARFAGIGSIVPSSLRVTLDGRDVSAIASAIGDTVTYTPRSALAAGTHDVAIAGSGVDGTPFAARWSFGDDFAFAAPPPPTPPPITSMYIDRYVVAGMNAFDVIVRGEPGLTGAVAVDGVNRQFPLFVGGYDWYVAHVVVPPGTFSPFAHVSARVQLPDGEMRFVTLPNTVPLVFATPQPAPPTPTPAPARTPLPRRAVPTPAPARTPLPRRAVPAPTPKPTHTPLLREPL